MKPYWALSRPCWCWRRAWPTPNDSEYQRIARDAIVVWANHDDTILDGHNRYRVCRAADVAFKTKAISFPSRDEAREWVICSQLGRRNLTEDQKSYLRGKRYQAEKKKVGRPEKGETVSPFKTSEKLADEYGVTDRTIKNDAKYADAVDIIGHSAGDEAKAAILSGEIKATRSDIVKLSSCPKAATMEGVPCRVCSAYEADEWAPFFSLSRWSVERLPAASCSDGLTRIRSQQSPEMAGKSRFSWWGFLFCC